VSFYASFYGHKQQSNPYPSQYLMYSGKSPSDLTIILIGCIWRRIMRPIQPHCICCWCYTTPQENAIRRIPYLVSPLLTYWASSNVLACIPLQSLMFFLPNFEPSCNGEQLRSIRCKLLKLHARDTFLLIGAGVCLLLALRYGGQRYAFSSAIIIGLFLVSLLLMMLFHISQWFKGEDALIKTRLLSNTLLLGGCMFLFFGYGTMVVVSTYFALSIAKQSFMFISTACYHT
jgi:hypothetical protein